jgi:Holliday junction resolvasome RuvABC DNA-binding subunit
VLTDIARLEQANAMMRTANQALARDDVVALVALGFSHQHIEELKQKGGFRSSSLAQNTRMITNLRKVGDANAQ